ncbi:1-acyl-sn-glycerol-3-phosphate acyltransferase [Lacihabitans lacunae]|uniref:1-acyl-sn-glycerol-3-phosphate acyltransferase n=1 Tax=Lacihabitans lacunae TaxID=1028214 RepID=A0ABV7YV97_9BACT
MNAIFKFFFDISGWKIEGNVPTHLSKAAFVVCPHNTWKDFFVGLGLRAKMGMNIGYIGKAELFKPPFGFIFRWLGGTPAYRTSSNNMVDSYVAAIKSKDEMLFALAPEGTRKNVDKLRSGFYFMANGAQIPIVRVGFDLKRKVVVIGEPFIPSGDFEADMQKYFVNFFDKIQGPQKDWIKNYKAGKF